MNWAHNFMVALPQIEHLVTAPILFDNEFTNGVEILRAPHQKIFPVPFDEWSVPLYYRGFDKICPGIYNRWLERWIRCNPPDIVHAHFGGVAVRHMKQINRSGIPFVSSFYGFDMEKLPYKKPEYTGYYRELAGIVNAAVVLGESSRQTLIERYGFEEGRVFVHPLGVDTARVPFHTKKKSPDGLRLLQIATLTPKKGQLDAVKALHRAISVHENIRLTLVGERWEASYVQSVEDYIEQHGLNEKVKLLPFIPHDQIFELMAKHDVFIHPSQYTEDRDSEGGATFAILEAMAAGLPVISTAHRAIPERVIDGEMGFIVQEKDINGLSDAILRMYEMVPGTFMKMSQACRKQVERNFDSKGLAGKMKSFYEQIALSK